jgi:hypothetical protein
MPAAGAGQPIRAILPGFSDEGCTFSSRSNAYHWAIDPDPHKGKSTSELVRIGDKLVRISITASRDGDVVYPQGCNILDVDTSSILNAVNTDLSALRAAINAQAQ